MDRLLLRPAEAAEAIGVSRSRVYELLASGELPSIRVGRTVRVPVAALHAWINEHLKKTSGAGA
jgi:excisionase family DNA binding protein